MDKMSPGAAPADGRIRPKPEKMRPYEWMYFDALDRGAVALAEACDLLRGSWAQAMDDANWQGSRRLEVQAEADKLREELERKNIAIASLMADAIDRDAELREAVSMVGVLEWSVEAFNGEADTQACPTCGSTRIKGTDGTHEPGCALHALLAKHEGR